MLVDTWSGLILLNLVVALSLATATAIVLRKPTVDRRVALAFLAFQLDMVIWTFGRLRSYLGTDLAASYFWLRVFFVGACLFGPVWLTLALAWTGRAGWLTSRRLALVAAPGVALYAGLLTNEWHWLFLTSVEHRGRFGGLVYSGGPLYWAVAVLTYLYVGLGIVLYIRSARTATSWLRRQSLLTVIIAVPPIVAGILMYFRVAGVSVELTHVMISAGGTICAFSIFRRWLLDVVRIALTQAVEQMGDAIVVLDLKGRILDANPAFGQILHLAPTEIVGRHVGEMVAGLPGRIANPDQFDGLRLALLADPWQRISGDVVMEGSPNQTYELTVWPIRGNRNDLIGRVVTLRDVTQARAVAQNLLEVNDRLSERTTELASALEQVHRLNDGLEAWVAARTRDLSAAVANLEALHETALAITSVRDLGATLRLILNAVRHLTAADQTRISILARNGDSFVVRADLDDSGECRLTPVSRHPSALTREIIKGRQARFVEDVERESAQRSSAMNGKVQAYAGVPLISRDLLVGILYVTYNQPHPFTPANRRLIQTLASQAAVAIANAQMFEEINRAATTDSLTELPNHRHLMDRLDEEIARARRSDHPLALMMIDVDDFKLVNDAHGHMVGDEVLRLVARVLRDTFRPGDIVGRYGGDEFLALLPETDRGMAMVVAERVADAIRAQQFRTPQRDAQPGSSGSAPVGDDAVPQADGVVTPLRLSVGVAIYPYDSGTGLELISLADAAMYASRQAGGNTTTLADTTDSGFLAAQNATFGVLEALVNAVDGKDRYTRAHSEQVARYALGLADVLGLPDESKRMLRIAGLLHDVGKIGIADRILRKPGPLDLQERAVVEQHPLLGEMIVREVPVLPEVLGAVRHHHERYDGTGYPRGLRGREIPFLSRVIAIADAYSAMILDRPYRRALSVEEAVEELRKGVGTQFDPELVEPFVQSLASSCGSATLKPMTAVPEKPASPGYPLASADGRAGSGASPRRASRDAGKLVATRAPRSGSTASSERLAARP